MKKNKIRTSFGTILRQGHYLYYLKNWIYSSRMDLKIFHSVINKTVFNETEGIYPAQCISYPYLKELEKHLILSKDDIFVDVGCAWGRLIGYLKQKVQIRKFIGIEINYEIAQFAKKAFQKDDNVEIIQGDVISSFPSEGTVFYLFNPFDESYLKLFLDQIEANIHHPVQLLYLHPTCRHVIDNNENWTLIKETNLSPNNYGSVLLCIYEKNSRKGYNPQPPTINIGFSMD